MQLSRGFFLTPEKTIKRKLTEMLIAEELEQKFSKQQIFEFYANWVELGQRGSFAISGFAEASKAYFNKDLKDITLPEAALLAGMIQRPSYLSPYRHPERALERRNLVLESMVETHAITREQADKAKAAPLKLAPPNVEASDAPYFVDMVRDQLISKFNENELNDQSYRIYTTLDPDLQKAAAQSVEMGIKLVDDQVKKLRTKKVKVGKKFETTVAAGSAGAGGDGGARSAHGRGAGAGGRARLRLEPVESRGGEAADGIDLQAVCVCGGDEHGAGWIADGADSGVDGDGCAVELRLRRPDLRAAQLQRGVPRAM